jgi:hypothetical protein
MKMNDKSRFDDNGLIPVSLNQQFLEKFKAAVFDFSEQHKKLMALSGDAFYKQVLLLQKYFNASDLIVQFCSDNKNLLSDLCETEMFSYSGSGFLRVVRPNVQHNKQKADEFLGFHREVFYGTSDYVKKQINVHIPIFNYNALTAMKYVPASHLIADEDLLLEALNEGENGIVRGNLQHLNGLMYAPKKIVSGCDMTAAIPFDLKIGEAVAFKSDLIHGAGINTTSQIRVSLDFAVIPTAAVPENENFQIASSDGVKYIPFV